MESMLSQQQKLEAALESGPPKKKRRLVSAVIDEKGFRLRSGCFPIRINPETNERETLLITCRNRLEHERWCIPSGPIDPGEIAAEAATRGTREEAGVIGRLRDPERPLGVWTNHDRRSKTSLFVLDVTQELSDKWEGSDRARKWFTLPEAEEVLQWKPLNLVMLNSLKERLGLLKRPDERRMDNLIGELDRGIGAPGEEEEEESVKSNSSFVPQPGLAATINNAAQVSDAIPSVALAVKLGEDLNGIFPHHHQHPHQHHQHHQHHQQHHQHQHQQHQHHHGHLRRSEEEEEEEEEPGLIAPPMSHQHPAHHLTHLRLQQVPDGLVGGKDNSLPDTTPVVYLRQQPLEPQQQPPERHVNSY